MRLILILIALTIACNGVYNLDESSEVYIDQSGSVQMSKSSNPTTGFSWYINPSSLGVVTTDDLDGEYVSGNSGLLGAGGIQIFTVACTDLCAENTHTSIILEYMQPWINEPVDTVEVIIHITS